MISINIPVKSIQAYINALKTVIEMQERIISNKKAPFYHFTKKAHARNMKAKIELEAWLNGDEKGSFWE